MPIAPSLGSILLASADPTRLRAWYERAFDATVDSDGFLRFGEVAVLIDGRDDVVATNPEPARVILNFHVDDAQATARHLDQLGVTWLVKVEYREAGGAWFGTLLDPDGNWIQIIELTDVYWATRRPSQQARLLADGTLRGSSVASRLPVQDLERARRFYAEKLGLEPADTRPGGLRYHCGQGAFALFASSGRPSGEHTQMAWEVEDIQATVAELRSRGVVFEEIDVPGLRTVDGIATVSGNYSSAGGVGERAAWFRDSEGNLLSIGQMIRDRSS